MIIRGVVNELNNFGFDCYWAGNNGALAWAGVVPENGRCQGMPTEAKMAVFRQMWDSN